MTAITELTQSLTAWIRWLRFRRAVTWALRGLLIGLAIALGMGLIGLFQSRLLRAEFIALVLFSALAFTLGFGLVALLWPVQRLWAARYFDREFGLKERVSTALELGGQDGEMSRRQLDDALNAAKTVVARRQLPLRFQKHEGWLALTLVILLGLLWFRGEAWFQSAQQARNVQQAVAEQSENIEELIFKIENNPELSEEQKKLLTAPLNEALNQLQNNPSLENSVSTLVSTSEKLQSISSTQALQSAQALQQAGSQLAGQEGSPLQSVGEKLSQGNLLAAASELANMDLSTLSPEELTQMADQLESLAQSLASTNPQLAQQLSQAAEALQNGDTAAAQAALSQAAQSMAQAGQQASLSQAAGQASQTLQQGAGQVIAAGGGQGNSQTAQNSQGQGSSQGESESSGSGSGSGKGQGSGSQSQGSESGSDPIPQNNGAGDGGETTYEQIYAPSLLGGEGGETVALPDTPGEGGEVIGQGPVTPGEDNPSLVPYTDVFSQYEQINRQAIENGDIPFEFAQIIRNYFDSLRP